MGVLLRSKYSETQTYVTTDANIEESCRKTLRYMEDLIFFSVMVSINLR